MVKNLKNRIAIILDRSSSMGSMRDQAIEMFNEQVDTIIEENEDMDTKVSLVTFSTNVDEPEVWNKPIDSLGKLTKRSYQPNGMTAMYDAVGMTIDKLRALPEADDENCSFLITVISDGMENASREYTSSMLASRVKKLQDKGNWTFTYLGAEQDLTQVSAATGIKLDNMQVFTASAGGMRGASASSIGAVTNYFDSRKKGATAVKCFYGGKKEADVLPDDHVDVVDQLHELEKSKNSTVTTTTKK